LTFDKAGRLSTQTGPNGQSVTYTYYNTGKMSGIDDAAGVQSRFSYDKAGNRTFESHAGTQSVYNWTTLAYETATTLSHQYSTATYDEVGRVKQIVDSGANGSVPTDIRYEYDLQGNVRRVKAEYRLLDAQGNASSTVSGSDHWYRYDSMNRFVTSMGELKGTNAQGQVVTGDAARGIGTIVKGWGVDITYDQAGQRRTATRFSTDLSQKLWKYTDSNMYETWWESQEVQQYGGTWSYADYAGYDGDRKEIYNYRADGQLDSIGFDQDMAVANGLGGVDIVAMNGSAVKLRVDYDRDAMGRITQQTEYGQDMITVLYSRAATYNMRGEVTGDVVAARQHTGSVITTTANYDYKLSNVYQGGSVIGTTTTGTIQGTGGTPKPTSTVNEYAWYDDARLTKTNYDGDTSSNSTNVSWVSSYKYDSNGHLSSVKINDDRDRTVSYVTDARGQVLSRKEVDTNTSTGDPKQLHYYFDGMKVGEVSNNGPAELDYAVALNYRTANIPASSPWRYETHWSVADFDQSYDPVTTGSRGTAGTASSYTVRDGDSLRSIAQMVWGDGAMWYLIADANGLSGSEQLAAGQTISIPAKVTNIHNSSETFRVYDPNKAIGDTSPIEPKPQKNGDNMCAVVGQIALVMVAVAVSFATYGALTGPATSMLGMIAAGAASGAAGSIASQGVGIATGIQDRFDWKSVGIAAVTAGVSRGADRVLSFGQIAGSTFLADAARGAAVNAVSQGVAVATGLQKKFDWAGIASAAVVSGVTSAVSRAMPGRAQAPTEANPRGIKASFENIQSSGAAGALAGAAARSILTGTSFGDNILRVLPDVIGSTLGNAVAEGLSLEGTSSRSMRQAEAEARRARGAAEDAANARRDAAQDQLDLLEREGLSTGALQSQGITLTATPQGLFAEGYTPARLAAAVAETPNMYYGVDGENGDISGSIYRWLDTAPDPRFQAGMIDDGGLNLYYGPNAGHLSSKWVGYGNGSVIRFITGANGTYVYSGGDQEFSALDLRVSYGEQAPPVLEPIAAPVTTSIATGAVEQRGFLSGIGYSFANGLDGIIRSERRPYHEIYVPVAEWWNRPLVTIERRELTPEERPAAQWLYDRGFGAHPDSYGEDLVIRNGHAVEAVGAIAAPLARAGGTLVKGGEKVVGWVSRVLGGTDDAVDAGRAVTATRQAADDVIQGVDASTLNRTHSISGKPSTTRVDGIAANMREVGYRGPAIDVIEDQGQYYIIDGHHRALAAQMTRTPVNVRPVRDLMNHPSNYNSLSDVLRSADTVGPDRLVRYRRPGR
jgi:YD repeat-containing protein